MITHHETLSEYESVAQFYAGKSVFMTGITGLLGKVFLEKLLYSCKDIENVYVLIRSKKNLDFKQRLQEIFKKPLFSRLKAERPQDFRKVIPIVGDVDEPNLGISTTDEKLLLDKVSVVIHAAALVRFNEPLKSAVRTNVLGTKCILDLCQRMKNIKAFIHISTAYSHTYLKVLEEKVYPPLVELDRVFKFLEQPNRHERDVQELIKGHPNNYTFTKELAEYYVAEHRGSVPTIIVRPSIISCSIKEPMPGWIDNWIGASGLVMAVGKGASRVIPGDGNDKLDLIPVDYVVNLSIVAATKCKSSDVSVYNCSTSSCNSITIKETYKHIKTSATKTGFNNKAHVSLKFTRNRIWLIVLTFLLQTLPAFFGDVFLRLRGKKPRFMKIQSKVLASRSTLTYFVTNSWDVKMDRVLALYDSMSPEDRRQFPCNPFHINWAEYIALYLEGIDRFLLNKNVEV